MADEALRNAVHAALYRVAARFGADDVQAIQAANAECAALDAAFGAQRHYWPAADNRARNREILDALKAGRPADEVALCYGVSVNTVRRLRRAYERPPEKRQGFGSDDWVIK